MNREKVLARLLACCAVSILIGCGSEDGGMPAPAPTPTPDNCALRTVDEFDWGGVAVGSSDGEFLPISIDADAPGIIEVTATWEPSPPFYWDLPIPAANHVTFPMAPGETLDQILVCAPDAVGEFEGTLTIEATDCAPRMLPLHCAGFTFGMIP